MSIIATIDVPAEEFALGNTFTSVPGLRLEAERVAAHGSKRALPYIWFRGSERTALDDALADDGSVETARVVQGADDRWLYRVEWSNGKNPVTSLLDNGQATVMDAKGSNESWRLQLRFDERASLSDAFEQYRDEGGSFSVRRIQDLDQPRVMRAGLTACQFDTLRLAHERGYYQVPRRTDLSALAEELNISHQALSERIRRAHGTLVGDLLNDTA